MVLRTVSGRRDLCLAEPSLGAVQAGVLQAAASPDCYRPYLAQSLDNLARALRQQGLLPLGQPVPQRSREPGGVQPARTCSSLARRSSSSRSSDHRFASLYSAAAASSAASAPSARCAGGVHHRSHDADADDHL
jgi:hypothetical protein